MWFLQFPADLVTFTVEILNGKLHFLCSVCQEPFEVTGKKYLLIAFLKDNCFQDAEKIHEKTC